MTLSRLPCAGQQVLAGSPCEIQLCVHVHPRLPNCPFPPSATITNLKRNDRHELRKQRLTDLVNKLMDTRGVFVFVFVFFINLSEIF